jgi:phage shock protein C
MKKFYLSDTDKKLGGVCGGIAEYLDVDSTFVRLLFVLFALLGGLTIFIYIVLWIIAPRRPKEITQPGK